MWETRPTLNGVMMFPGSQPFLACHEQFGDCGGSNSDYNNSFNDDNNNYNNKNNNYNNISCQSFDDLNNNMYYNNNNLNNNNNIIHYNNNNMHYNYSRLLNSNNIDYNNNISYFNNNMYYNNNIIDYNINNNDNYNNNNSYNNNNDNKNNVYNNNSYNNNNNDYNNNNNNYNNNYCNTSLNHNTVPHPHMRSIENNASYPIPLEFTSQLAHSDGHQQHAQEAPPDRSDHPLDPPNDTPSSVLSSGGDAGDEGLLLIPHRTGDTIYYVASPASSLMHADPALYTAAQESPGRTDGPHREFHVLRRSQMYDINGVPIIAETGLLLTVTVWTMAMTDWRQNNLLAGWLHVVTAVENGYVTRLRHGRLEVETHVYRGSDHNEELLLYGEAIPVFG